MAWINLAVLVISATIIPGILTQSCKCINVVLSLGCSSLLLVRGLFPQCLCSIRSVEFKNGRFFPVTFCVFSNQMTCNTVHFHEKICADQYCKQSFSQLSKTNASFDNDNYYEEFRVVSQ